MNEIYGGAAVTPMLVPDWNQNNPNRADYIKNKPDVAGAIKCSASGNPIRLDDVSPLEHEMAVGVKSKNLWRFEDMKHTGGATPTKTETGLITNGGIGKTFVCSNTWLVPISCLDGMDLTISCDVVPSGNNKPRLGLNYVSEDNVVTASIKETGTLGMNASIPLKVDSTKANGGKYIQFRFCSNVSTTTDGLTSSDIATWSNFQIEIGTKATVYTPYLDVNGATVQKLGKNIWKFEDMTRLANWSVQKTETGFKAAAESTQQYVQGSYRWLPISALDGKTLVISCTMTPSGKNKPLIIITFCDESGSTPTETPNLEMTKSGSVAFAVDSTKANGCKYIKFIIYKNGGSTESTKEDYVDYSNFQIEIGNTTAYEPYHSETFTADENGKVNGIIGNGEDITLMGDGVTITAEYNADTKKYIDKKFAELQALVLEV